MKTILAFLATLVCGNTVRAQLQIAYGTSWKSDNSTYVVLDNLDIQYDAATALFSNTFKFTGNTDAGIRGEELPVFRSIELAKTNNAKIILQRDFNLVNNFTFTSGLCDLNGFIIFMGTNALLVNENESSRLMGTDGYARIIADLNAPNAVNPGNLGAVITSSQNLGSTYVYRGVKSQTNGSGNGNSILRTYDIIPASNTGLDAALRFNYFDAELNGLNENLLELWKSNDNINWSLQGYTSRNSVTNYVEKTGINDFSKWTLSTPGNALPLRFVSFTVNCETGRATLNWKTAQEENTSHFEIEKAEDGYHFSVIGTIAAAGNSGGEKNYSFTDNNVSSENNYYRIKEVDADGRSYYSGTNTLQCGKTSEKIKLWPNPVEQYFTVQLSSRIKTDVTVNLYDEKGSFVYTKTFALLSGSNNIAVNIGHLPAGTYWVHIGFPNNSENKTVKIIKI
ncbi:MAG: T9SS type A sorting domain-containing protein [Sphingobacteriales bacterium]|nr:T9SS type A sorting domain-containing protein [Sphingobacteriales bacterium]